MTMSPRRSWALLGLALLFTAPATARELPSPNRSRPAAATSAAPAGRIRASDVLRAPRPTGGEWFGLYLQGKKVGYIYTHLEPVPNGDGTRARLVSEYVFKAMVGGNPSERYLREERIYEARPSGRLLSFTLEQRGDGGEQTLEATATHEGLRVVRKRPGRPNQILTQPPSPETIEDADQARTALIRNETVRGTITDSQDLKPYRVTSTLLGEETHTLAGVKTRLRRVRTVSEKEKVPVEALITPEGAIVEIHFGPMLVARAESAKTARDLEQVEVFGLTRVVLPSVIPESQARAVPGAITFTLKGLPRSFHRDTHRQTYRVRPDGTVAVTIRARGPAKKTSKRPLTDPSGGTYLGHDLSVESDHPDIRKLAQQIAGGEPDAWKAAVAVNRWVARNLKKAYGASADRATDVLAQRKGDCTEHSLLAVSLLRALGIPAKRADGVVYLRNDDGVPAFYWHEWVSVWTGSEWVDMDPTFNQTIADATHLALGEEGSAEITPLIGQIAVTAVRVQP